MKLIPSLILVLLYLSSCSQDSGLIMPVASTMKIEQEDSDEVIIQKASHIVPRAIQYEAMKREYIAFIHFGPNTFTRMEWGSGMEDPAEFDLQNLDTDQWCRVIKDAGMKLVILTAKHHDGFCLWQSRYTNHGVASSPYKSGTGDIVKELSESCKKYGLKLGIYLSPADLFQIESPTGLYGNLSEYTRRTIPRIIEERPFKNQSSFEFEVDDYNEYYLNQLFELLTEYGPIHEIWLDGAHPKRKGNQQYHYAAWKELIRTLAPEAVIFGREDIRWCGNEQGGTRDKEWNIIPYPEDPNQMTKFRDITEYDIASREKLLEGNYLHYQPAETNTSIRDGWFYRNDDEQRVKSADEIFDIYERSVGGNSTFLLNIPPNREGKFSDRDVDVLTEVGNRIRKTYSESLLKGAKGPKAVLDDDPASYFLVPEDKNEIVIVTPGPVTVNRFMIQESITTHSERIEAHALDAWLNEEWIEIARGTNVGYKRILRFPDVTTDRFRVRILETRMPPAISKVGGYYYQGSANPV